MSPRVLFEQDLETLKNKVSEMGEHAEISYDRMAYGIRENKEDILKTLLNTDHTMVDMQRSIEAMCLSLLTRQQPVARDMRLVSAALKVVPDIERIGDHVADIVELYLRMGNMNPEGKQEHLLLEMMEEAKEMIHNSVEAFVEGDEANARKVVEHDDVVDESDMRRGRATANSAFGNAASVLVGDFIYTRAFQLVAQLQSLDILRIMADATNVLAEGEVQQLMNVNDPDTTEESYMRVIYSKTARLFEVAAQSVTIVAGAEKSIETAFQEYGRYLGTAFQLVDDVLDYSANAAALGKNVGDDLAEGKPTLPLLHAMRHGNPQQAALIREAIEQGGKRDAIDAVLAIMAEHKSLDYAMDRAKQEAQKAVDAIALLPESEYKKALISLAYLSVDRTY